MTAARKQPSSPRVPFVPEAPPKVMEGHAQDLKGGRRGAYRQTKSDPFRVYADAGQITEEMFVSADWYQDRCKEKAEQGRDSTNVDRVYGSSSGTGGISEVRSDAIKKLLSVDSHLSEADRKIIRAMCEEGHHATMAVFLATKEDRKGFAIPRLKEALDNLTTAIARARASGWKFHLTAVNQSDSHSAG